MLSQLAALLGAALQADVPAPERAPAPSGWTVELTTLRLLHEKGVLSDAELDSAARDVLDTEGVRAPDGTTLAVGRFALTAYGFVELRLLYDTTQSFGEQQTNVQVARPDSFAGTHDRFQLSARASRLGFRLKAPPWAGVRASAVVELDFSGTQLPAPSLASEAAQLTVRARHYYLKVETPVVDLLAGQAWSIFTGQPASLPATLDLHGLPGEVYARVPQLRLSRRFELPEVSFDLALAVTRGPQRDSAVPDGAAAARVTLTRWTGWATQAFVASSQQSASLGVSGLLRSYRVPAFVAAPTTSSRLPAGGVAAHLLLPLVPGTAAQHAGALTLVGQYAWSTGLADQYVGLTGGVAFPTLPGWPQDLDNGLVAIDAATGAPVTVQWSSCFVNLQWYLPVWDGRVLVSTLYSRLWSDDTARLGAPARTRASLDWLTVAAFADLLPSVRVGLEYAVTFDRYADGAVATNHRADLAAVFAF